MPASQSTFAAILVTIPVVMAWPGAAAAQTSPQAAPAATTPATSPASTTRRPDPPFTGADIDAATYAGQGDLPPGRSPLTAKVQMLLDHAGVSPGVTDGFKGGMSDSAIRAFERKLGLPVDGRLDPEVWAHLQDYAATGPITQSYTITDADAAGLVKSIPTDYLEKANMVSLGFTSVAERLGERFHMDEKFIAFLNPGVELVPGATITVMAPAKPLRGAVTRIIVDKASGRVAAYDAAGKLVADYPATVGSTATPSPSGNHRVEGVAQNPEYTYNPNVNFKQGDNDRVLTIPPGPNGPVGSVWIDLDKPTYGIHGTPTPSQLFVNQSHGCVRLTNWDAEELSRMVKPGVTMVEFLAPGQTIAGVTDAVTPAPARSGTTEAAAPVGSEVAPAGAVAGGDGTAAASTAAAPAGGQGNPPTVVPLTGDPAADPLAAALQAATGGAAAGTPGTPPPAAQSQPADLTTSRPIRVRRPAPVPAATQ